MKLDTRAYKGTNEQALTTYSMLTPLAPFTRVALIFPTNKAASRPTSTNRPTDLHPQPLHSPRGLHSPRAYLHVAFIQLTPSVRSRRLL